MDFVRLAARYCQLKKRGKNYWALCPFHKEKTPSFSIDAENGLYHCFGCKEGGNVFSFLQKMEGVSFGEAVRLLAAEAGIDVTSYEGRGAPDEDERVSLREAHELATTFYQKCLEKARGGTRAREYLKGRQISAESVELWRLGYAPEGWDHFLNCATGRGYNADLLERAGLVLARQSGGPGHYDRFRNRLIFPIADTAGRPIGFGARALSPDDEPKYLNSPDTPLFSKGSCFFGLDRAKPAVRSGDTAVVLEGYTDVIMAHQAGVTETLAVLGTALTEQHARTLRRLCSRVILVFDADEAGQKSAARSVEVLLNEELEVRVAELPAGLDPCDYILQHGGEKFRERLEESLGFFEFRMGLARGRHDTGTVQGKTAAFREMVELAAGLRDAAQREMVVQWIADEFRVSPGSVWQHLQRLPGPARARATSTAPDGRPERTGLTADDSLPGEVLGLLLAHPDYVPEAVDRLDTEMLRDGPEKTVLERLLGDLDQGSGAETRDVLNSLAEPALASAASRALAEERSRETRVSDADENTRERFEGYVEYLKAKRDAAAAELSAPVEMLDDRALKAREKELRDRDRQSSQGR